MTDYTIYVDSACDIPLDTLEKWGVKCVQLSVLFTDSNENYKNFDLPAKILYDRMRGGSIAKTSAVNLGDFRDHFEEECKAGKDVLYIGFSSGLSSTVESGAMAAKELEEEYTDRKLVVVDSLAASAGYGLLVYLAAQKKQEGASLEEVVEFVKERVPHMAHWFTVDDLKYLKQGGRISAAAAFVGGALKIKPVLHVDDEGHLVNVSKVRGRKASIQALFDQYKALAEHPEKGPVYVSHGDCLEDVKTLEAMLVKEYGIGLDEIVWVGPVIGAHSGPGTLAFFFEAKHK